MSSQLLSFDSLAFQLCLFFSNPSSFLLGCNSNPFGFGLFSCLSLLLFFGGLQSNFTFFFLFAKTFGLGGSDRCFLFLLDSGLLGRLFFEFFAVIFGLVGCQFFLLSFFCFCLLTFLFFLLLGLLACPVFLIFLISLIRIDLELDTVVGHIAH